MCRALLGLGPSRYARGLATRRPPQRLEEDVAQRLLELREVKPCVAWQWGRYCADEGGGDQDPLRHGESFIREFLAREAAGRLPAVRLATPAMVKRLRRFQRQGGAEATRAWHDYARTEGLGIKDPRLNAAELVQRFLDGRAGGAQGSGLGPGAVEGEPPPGMGPRRPALGRGPSRVLRRAAGAEGAASGRPLPGGWRGDARAAAGLRVRQAALPHAGLLRRRALCRGARLPQGRDAAALGRSLCPESEQGAEGRPRPSASLRESQAWAAPGVRAHLGRRGRHSDAELPRAAAGRLARGGVGSPRGGGPPRLWLRFLARGGRGRPLGHAGGARGVRARLLVRDIPVRRSVARVRAELAVGRRSFLAAQRRGLPANDRVGRGVHSRRVRRPTGAALRSRYLCAGGGSQFWALPRDRAVRPPCSVALARANAARNGAVGVRVLQLDSAGVAQALASDRRPATSAGAAGLVSFEEYGFCTALVDPPRWGLDGETRDLLHRFPNVVYFSCNPATQALDLRQLLTTHEVQDCALFDQFPYTGEIESGLFLTRRRAPAGKSHVESPILESKRPVDTVAE
ncbi:unnamed protein product [Prorocentrum cordatum]|uniref:Uncharacterized protein n=1 Tax=Prorocentrum cordatum TaxID=2364126 RepID=A0ABN9V156_9DINO|nr:unnamed protein product [Polarella glacialis]